jgi:hypothetical protein
MVPDDTNSLTFSGFRAGATSDPSLYFYIHARWGLGGALDSDIALGNCIYCYYTPVTLEHLRFPTPLFIPPFVTSPS